VDEPLLLAPLLEPARRAVDEPDDDRRVLDALRDTSPLDVRAAGAGVVVNAVPLSTADMLSSGARC
jgi:hypothetical protein